MKKGPKFSKLHSTLRKNHTRLVRGKMGKAARDYSVQFMVGADYFDIGRENLATKHDAEVLRNIVATALENLLSARCR